MWGRPPSSSLVPIRHLVLSTVLLVGACARQSSNASPSARGDTHAALIADLDAKAPAWLAEYGVPSVAVAYIEDGALRWTRVYGEQSERVPATARTLYNVASLAKPVFAEVIMRLVAEGRLSLDEPLASYWVDPDVAADPRHTKLTLRIALSH